MPGLDDTRQSKNGGGLGPRTEVITLAKTNMTQDELDAALQYLEAGGVAGTNDGFTIVGVQATTPAGAFVSGTTDVVHVAIQGTGVNTVGSNFGIGSTGVTAALVVTFNNTLGE